MIYSPLKKLLAAGLPTVSTALHSSVSGTIGSMQAMIDNEKQRPFYRQFSHLILQIEQIQGR
jgi:hypothetical protein